MIAPTRSDSSSVYSRPAVSHRLARGHQRELDAALHLAQVFRVGRARRREPFDLGHVLDVPGPRRRTA